MSDGLKPYEVTVNLTKPAMGRFGRLSSRPLRWSPGSSAGAKPKLTAWCGSRRGASSCFRSLATPVALLPATQATAPARNRQGIPYADPDSYELEMLDGARIPGAKR